MLCTAESTQNKFSYMVLPKHVDTFATRAQSMLKSSFSSHFEHICWAHTLFGKGKSKAVPLHACSGPEWSRNLRFPDFMTTAQDGGKVVSLTHRPVLPARNTTGTHLCWRLSRPQCHSASGRIMSLKNSNDTIGNRTRDLPVCSVVP
jgi:hypothetical protein